MPERVNAQHAVDNYMESHGNGMTIFPCGAETAAERICSAKSDRDTTQGILNCFGNRIAVSQRVHCGRPQLP